MLKDEVLNTIKEYNLISKNDKIVLAVSGGPDSIAMLHIFISLRKEYNLSLYVAQIGRAHV